jgi:hypothetical protein
MRDNLRAIRLAKFAEQGFKAGAVIFPSVVSFDVLPDLN